MIISNVHSNISVKVILCRSPPININLLSIISVLCPDLAHGFIPAILPLVYLFLLE